MNLLMVSGDRSMLEGKKGAFWYTLEAFSKEWERIDVICPPVRSYKLQATSYKPANLQLETRTFFDNVHFHPSPRGLWYQPQWIVKRGKQLVELFHHQVMTVHEFPPFYNGIGAWRLSRATGIPYVLEIHHLVGYPVAADMKERIGKVLSWFYLPWAIKRAACTRLVSKSTAETLIKWGAAEENIRVVPSFYLDKSMVESLNDLPPVQYDVVFCGRLVANKGAANLFRAMARVPRGTLLIIGDGPERENLKTLAKELGIEHRVEFRGWLPTQRDVLRAICSARAFVMNSTSEGGPRVALEAMACGMPVIVTRVGVMPDVIVEGVNGLFTAGDPLDLAAKIQHLLSDAPLRGQMGREAKNILERFERHKLITQYARFLKSFILNQSV